MGFKWVLNGYGHFDFNGVQHGRMPHWPIPQSTGQWTSQKEILRRETEENDLRGADAAREWRWEAPPGEEKEFERLIREVYQEKNKRDERELKKLK